jgi:preprotein translocase subunit Sec61beta
MTTSQSEPEDNDLQKMERIRYQYMLDRIQKFKSLIIAAILGMMAYAANATNSANNTLTIILLAISCITLLLSLVIAGMDAGGAVFYNERSQEGVSKKTRIIMYICILFAAFLIFVAQVFNAVEKLDDDPNRQTLRHMPNRAMQSAPLTRAVDLDIRHLL